MPGWVFGHAPVMPQLPVALFNTAQQGSIVHIHIGQAFTPEIVWLVSKLRGFRYIAQLHIDFEPSGPAGILLPFYKRFVLKTVLQSAACVVTLNARTLQTVREMYDYKGPARVMSNGLNDKYFSLNRAQLAPKQPDRLRLLFVGRLSKQKNIPALLGALRITEKNVHLDIVGDGDEYELIKKTIADHGLMNVTLHGRLGRKKVMEFYKTCDALIMPSLYEAQPLVLLEAMAARIPIIGTKVIGVEDHIKGVGICVEPTVTGLASGIEQYFEHYATLPEMVDLGYQQVKEMRWSRILKKYEALYESV
jgi:glycosyltransferase involved in cell wall biosynthesis